MLTGRQSYEYKTTQHSRRLQLEKFDTQGLNNLQLEEKEKKAQLVAAKKLFEEKLLEYKGIEINEIYTQLEKAVKDYCNDLITLNAETAENLLADAKTFCDPAHPKRGALIDLIFASYQHVVELHSVRLAPRLAIILINALNLKGKSITLERAYSDRAALKNRLLEIDRDIAKIDAYLNQIEAEIRKRQVALEIAEMLVQAKKQLTSLQDVQHNLSLYYQSFCNPVPIISSGLTACANHLMTMAKFINDIAELPPSEKGLEVLKRVSKFLFIEAPEAFHSLQNAAFGAVKVSLTTSESKPQEAAIVPAAGQSSLEAKPDGSTAITSIINQYQRYIDSNKTNELAGVKASLADPKNQAGFFSKRDSRESSPLSVGDASVASPPRPSTSYNAKYD